MIPRRIFWLFDALGVALCFAAAYLLFPHLRSSVGLIDRHFQNLAGWFMVNPDWSATPPPPPQWLWALLIVLSLTLLLNEFFGAYRSLLETSRTRIVVTQIATPMIGLSVVTMVEYALKSQHLSRFYIFLSVGLTCACLVGYRLVLRAYWRRRLQGGYYAKNVVLLGSTSALEGLLRYFATDVSTQDYRVCGYLRVDPTQPDPDPALGAVLLGHAEELGDILIHRPIAEVIAIQAAGESDWLTKCIQDCDYFRVPIWIVPQALMVSELRDLHCAVRTPPLHLPAIALRPPEHESEALFLKRLLDIAVAAPLLLLLSPLFVVIAALIKLTTPDLPVFYPWRVVGLKGKEFVGYKFTTMVRDADALKQQLLDRNEMSGPVFKIKDDPRVTPLGRILRKFSLNELPQLWSVVRGDMSLVGPRPAGPHELARYDLWHKRKLSVQPGITCLWQVSGRNKISSFDDWVKLDLAYIRDWSLWLDVKILARTAWVVIVGSGS
jgi:exopolysaccharide biosynthesis polyprenyl glycosylphosphotransferase